MPGVAFQVRPPAPAPTPLRTDVAGVIARTERGPISLGPGGRAAATRVQGWHEFVEVFGELTDHASGYAVRGYFENGGQLLWVVRVASAPSLASAVLDVKGANGTFGSTPPGGDPIPVSRLTVTASSPGEWGAQLEVQLRLRRGGTPSGEPVADLLVLLRRRPVEHLLGLMPGRVVEEVSERSRYVRLAVAEAHPGPRELPARRQQIFRCALMGGSAGAPGLEEYERAAIALVEEPEPSLLFAPDARADLGTATESFYAAWAAAAAASLDRLVLVDPPDDLDSEELARLAKSFRSERPDLDPRYPAAAALYYPHLRVQDPRGTPLRPTRTVPPSGHVAGLYSTLDRDRGAHHTPANAPLLGAVDLSAEYDDAERAALNQNGLNALRCSRGRGVEVWGGRTLHLEPARRYVAHRRLIHLLVRAMRRTAEPLVFDSNTPLLRLMLVRALTSVLLEAFRAGSLKGERPEHAFRVQCDDSTHPPGALDTGTCVAHVELAPAVPMEFITLTVGLSRDGSLEVIE